MLGEILQTGKKIDFCFIDGRISNEDCALFEKVFTEDAVIVIDDFEGVEKGVINVMMLRNKFPGMFYSNHQFSLREGRDSISPLCCPQEFSVFRDNNLFRYQCRFS